MRGVIDSGIVGPVDAVRGSQLVVLATPVLAIVDLIEAGAGPARENAAHGRGQHEGCWWRARDEGVWEECGEAISGGASDGGKGEQRRGICGCGIVSECGLVLTPLPGQNLKEGLFAEFAGWIDQIGARMAMLPPEDHDRLCAWISHVPQMISTALAAALVEEFGEEAPLLPAGGRALQEMTRISASPYSMWRDIAISNKKNLEDALFKVEQRLAHIRENLATRQLAEEFEQAHGLRKRRENCHTSHPTPSSAQKRMSDRIAE